MAYDEAMFESAEEEAAYKVQFAAALLREPHKPFIAATTVFGTNTGRALYAASRWLHDPIVTTQRDAMLKEKGARAFLPTKEDFAREVWARATDEKVPVEDRTRLLSLYGDVMGFKETAQKNSGGITINNNKVMMLKDFGDDANWEAKAAAQQHALTHDAIDVTSKTLQ